MTETADVIVIGLGAMGAAALHQLARRGARVIGIDRFAPPHDSGSSHGETRITRQAIGEGEIYVPLVLRSHEIWRELEAETGEQLLLECGFVAIDSSGGQAVMHGKNGFAERTERAAERFGIAHEVLSPDELMHRFPGFTLRGDERVYYEPGGGLVYPERCIAAQLKRATALGARLQLNEAVQAIVPVSGGVRVTTSRGAYDAGHVVVAAGGWTPALIGSPLRRLQLLRQVLHWFVPDRPDHYEAGRFPTFIWAHGVAPEDSFYGFPIAPGATPGVKLATEQFSTEMGAPHDLDRTVTAAEVEAMHVDHADGRLVGLSRSALRSAACFYTNAPDGDFAIDHRPDSDRILVVSACSGHGFKHSAGIGEHVARVLDGEDSLRPAFALDRPALEPFPAGWNHPAGQERLSTQLLERFPSEKPVPTFSGSAPEPFRVRERDKPVSS
jgi:sarcosine oxidase